MTHDPVCYAEVDEKRAEEQGLSSEEAGRKYYFCSNECKERFDRDPGAFMAVYPEFQDKERGQAERPGDSYSI